MYNRLFQQTIIIHFSLLIINYILIELNICDVPFIPYIKSNPARSGILFVIGSLETERDGIRIMISQRALRIYRTKLSEIILAVGLNEIQFIIDDELSIHDFEHAWNI